MDWIWKGFYQTLKIFSLTECMKRLIGNLFHSKTDQIYRCNRIYFSIFHFLNRCNLLTMIEKICAFCILSLFTRKMMNALAGVRSHWRQRSYEVKHMKGVRFYVLYFVQFFVSFRFNGSTATGRRTVTDEEDLHTK